MLESVPQEVLERIASFVATQGLTGPPSGLPPLLLTCCKIYQSLSFEANPCLYARLFGHMFDTTSAFRRLGSYINTPRVLANELKKRWIYLKRIRGRTDCQIRNTVASPSPPTLIDLLWLAYLMMLENDGKNETQLLDFAEIDVWLMEYWFGDEGASLAVRTVVLQHAWPIDNERNAIAMWLLWFLLRPKHIMRNLNRFPHMMPIMKLAALASNHYPISRPSWTEFLPRSQPAAMFPSSAFTHFSAACQLTPPTLAPAAILTFLGLAPRLEVPPKASYVGGHLPRFPAELPLAARRSEDWDASWYCCTRLTSYNGSSETCSKAFTLGSVAGIWEGIFTYTEFTVHTMLLSGDIPDVLEHCLVAHHRQTWRLREYYLAESSGSIQEQRQPLSPGNPLGAHFPTGMQLDELSDSLRVQESGAGPVHYRKASSHVVPDDHRVIDILILGEGHSAWGQFTLRGRVRPTDGLINLTKEYVEGERGRWLYRGYLVGNTDGHISGRWRDTLSPDDVQGYEGCFVMNRRR